MKIPTVLSISDTSTANAASTLSSLASEFFQRGLMLPTLVPFASLEIKEAMKLQKQLHFVDEILKTLDVVMMDAGNSQTGTPNSKIRCLP